MRQSDMMNMVVVGCVAALMILGLTGCGNTVAGFGKDIVTIGENMSKPDVIVEEKKKID
jgi:predicted small secreted protein|tara:strand:+ start:240 stop:416 length:177 start_codon:yes stop_codon:yes gene_type:complete